MTEKSVLNKKALELVILRMIFWPIEDEPIGKRFTPMERKLIEASFGSLANATKNACSLPVYDTLLEKKLSGMMNEIMAREVLSKLMFTNEEEKIENSARIQVPVIGNSKKIQEVDSAPVNKTDPPDMNTEADSFLLPSAEERHSILHSVMVAQLSSNVPITSLDQLEEIDQKLPNRVKVNWEAGGIARFLNDLAIFGLEYAGKNEDSRESN